MTPSISLPLLSSLISSSLSFMFSRDRILSLLLFLSSSSSSLFTYLSSSLSFMFSRDRIVSRGNVSFLLWRHQILDPDSNIVTYWNHVFLITSILALFLDPFYFYVPYVGGPACLSVDVGLAAFVTFFHTVADLFHLLHILMKFRTAFVARSSRVFGRGELVMDSREIAKRYLRTDFFIDVAAMLPLPQVPINFFKM